MRSDRAIRGSSAALGFILASATTTSARDIDAVTFEVPFRLNGDYVGDLPARVSADGRASTTRDALSTLLQPHLTPRALQALESSLAQPAVDLTDTQAGPATIRYDTASVEFEMEAPADSLVPQAIDFAPEPAVQETPASPARLSAGAAVYLSQQAINGDDGLRGRIDIRANVGGRGGIYLFGSLEFEDRAPDRWRRGDTLAFFDDPNRALRFALGEQMPLFAGFQRGPSMRGVSVQRLFDRLQPQRNYRATGRNHFMLERDSTVSVQVNGATVRSLQLRAGNYDLRSLPLTEGVNDVTIVVEDDQGRRQEIEQTQFFDSALLDRGILVFAAHAGFLHVGDDADGPRYGDAPAFTGFVSYGATEALTLGADAQAASGIVMVGAQADWATPVGAVLFQGAASQSDLRGRGASLGLGWSWQGRRDQGAPRLDIAAEFASDGFATLGDRGRRDRILSSAAVRYQRVVGDATVRLAYANIAGEGLTQPRQRLSGGVSRRFGRMSLDATLEFRETHGRWEQDALATLVWRAGDRDLWRARHRARASETAVEYQRLPTAQLNEIHGRLEAVEDENGGRLSGDVNLEASRFVARVAHESVLDRDGSHPQQATRADLAFGIGFADGRVAFGRPATNGFAIVATDPALDGYPIQLRNGDSEAGAVRARSDGLGPLLVPLARSYAPERIGIDASSVPDELTPTRAAFALVPGAFSGYALSVETAHTVTVTAILQSPEGAPKALASGQLTDVDGRAPTIDFFTGRAGRLYASGLAPGRYRLQLTSGETADIEVAPAIGRTVDLGVVVTSR